MARPRKTKDASLSIEQAALFREKIRSVVDANKKASIELCQLVYESDVNMVRVNGVLKYTWEVWGYSTWEEFLGREMDLHLRTGMGLKRVWEVFYVDLAGIWNEELLLGITKMRLLSMAGLTAGNVEKWLKRAAGMNCRKLRATIFGNEETHSFKVTLTNSQLQQMRRTLDQLRSTLNHGEKLSRGELLVAMTRQWRDANKPLLSAA